MHAIQDFSNPDWCPNASWNGSITSFCEGMAADDVIAHEWTHAYTDATHDLIYQWQPGALNEAYSDIFGEIVDLLNGSGRRHAGPSAHRRAVLELRRRQPPPPGDHAPRSPSPAGYTVGGAVFNPASAVVGRRAGRAGDRRPAPGPREGCGPLAGLHDRPHRPDRPGNCISARRPSNAHDAGAVGVIVANDQGDRS